MDEIKEEILEKAYLTVTHGIGPNKMIAKISNTIQLPCLSRSQNSVHEYLSKVEFKFVPGINKVNEFILKGLGMNTCGDVIMGGNLENACKIFINFSEAAFDSLYKTCSGLASDVHESTQKRIVGVAH